MSKECSLEPIVLGAVRGAYGLKGWVKIQPFQDGTVLLSTRQWYLVNRDGQKVQLQVEHSQPHSGFILAKWNGCDTPEEANAIRGAVAVDRENFPALPEGEYYWVDLIGCDVINLQGESLGRVIGLRENGIHDILEVSGDKGNSLIPLVEAYLEKIDLENASILVDWSLDWN